MISEKEIIGVLSDVNFWGKPQKTGIDRGEYLEKILKVRKTEDIIAIIGVRRAGKTFITRQILKRLIESGARPEQTLYVNFEDHKLEPYLSVELLDLVYSAYRTYINGEDFAYMVFDEIHNIEKWEKWVRTMQDRREDIKIIITGSNAKLLRKEISAILTGRTATFNVFPLTFREFLDFKGIGIKKNYEVITKRQRIKRELAEYLEFGGFPKVVLERDNDVKIQMLKELFEGIVDRDIIIRNRVREEYTARVAAELCMANFSRLISANKLRNMLAGITKTKLSPNFVVKLLNYFDTAYLIFQLPIFSYKIREQKLYPKKIYSIDTGLINAVTIKFSENYGFVYENVVSIELMKRYGKENIFYWKDSEGKEVDFVIKQGLKVGQLVQVCYSLNKKTKGRELKALIKASKELRCKNLLVITRDYEAEENIDSKEINFIPLWKWLLS